MKLSDTLAGRILRSAPGSTCRIDGNFYKVGDDGDTLIELSPASEERAALEQMIKLVAFGPCPNLNADPAPGETAIFERASQRMAELEARSQHTSGHAADGARPQRDSSVDEAPAVPAQKEPET